MRRVACGLTVLGWWAVSACGGTSERGSDPASSPADGSAGSIGWGTPTGGTAGRRSDAGPGGANGKGGAAGAGAGADAGMRPLPDLPPGCPNISPDIETLAADPGPGGAVIVTEAFVYWQRPGDVYSLSGEILRKRKCDASAPVVLAANQDWPQGMAALGEDVVWANAGTYINGYSEQGSIWRSAGDSARLWRSEEGSAWAVATWNQQVFYSTRRIGGQIHELGYPGTSTELVDQRAEALAVDGDDLYWISPSAVSTRLRSGGAIMELAKAPYCNGEPGRALVIDQTHVYWLTECGDLSRVPRSGGPPQLLARAPNVARFGADGFIALDDDWLYFVETDALRAVPKQGGQPVVISPHLSAGAGGVSVDQTAVYWHSGSALLRAPRRPAP